MMTPNPPLSRYSSTTTTSFQVHNSRWNSLASSPRLSDQILVPRTPDSQHEQPCRPESSEQRSRILVITLDPLEQPTRDIEPIDQVCEIDCPSPL